MGSTRLKNNVKVGKDIEVNNKLISKIIFYVKGSENINNIM